MVGPLLHQPRDAAGAINSGTLIIALPDLERSLGTSLLQLVWVILAYMISSTVLVLTAGRLSDLFGRKRAYVGGFVVFALASLGAGFAADGTQLILWRILQGIGGAFLFANGPALVTDAFPREQLGLAMGTNTMVAAVGLVHRPGARRRARRDLLALGLLVQRPAGARRRRSGAALILRELARPRRACAASTSPAPLTFVVGLTGLVFGISSGGISGWDDPLVIGSLVAAAVLLPLFVLIEHRGKAPMLDLSIFRNRLFAAATAAAFINGLSRFALMFVFVFYYQGAQGDDPITAGIKLAPMAIGMLVASPLAGIWADRHGSRALAALGMLVTAARPGPDDDPAGRHRLLAGRALAGPGRHRLGHVQLAEHGGDDGHGADRAARHRRRRADDAAEHRRRDLDRLRAGDRHRRGPEDGPLQDLLRPRLRPLQRPARPLHPNMHTALWVLAATSLVGAGVSLLRPRDESAGRATTAPRPPRRRGGDPRGDRGDAVSAEPGPSCGSARSPSGPGRRRGPSATTRRSACCRSPAGASPAPTAPTPRPTSSG